MPESSELSHHVHCGLEGVRAVAKDGEKERGGQTMAQERGEAHPRGGEPFDCHESRLDLGQSLCEVRGRTERGGEPVS